MRVSSRLGRALLVLTALLAWAGIVLQCAVAVRAAAGNGHSPAGAVLHAFSYFTVLTNLLVAVVATGLLLWPRRQHRLGSPALLAATGVYIIVVGITYALLLRRLWAPQGLHWVADTLLHDVTPVLYVLWWLLYAPKRALAWSLPLKWLAYPALYALFLVILGAATGRYLYPFADVARFGSAAVVRNAVLMLGAFWGLGMLLVAVGRSVGDRGPAGGMWHSGV